MYWYLFGDSMICAFEGFDFGKAIFDVTKKAEGAAGAAVGPPLASSMQGDRIGSMCSLLIYHFMFVVIVSYLALRGLGVGMGMVQSIVASMIDTIPPLIPPLAWNNMPLTCAPMITGTMTHIIDALNSVPVHTHCCMDC